MKEILVITQKDVDPTYTENGDVDYKIRHATRAVLSDTNGKVALLHSTAHNYYKLPGGGVEPGEDTLVALARELLEEVGAVAEVTGEVGRTRERRVIQMDLDCIKSPKHSRQELQVRSENLN